MWAERGPFPAAAARLTAALVLGLFRAPVASPPPPDLDFPVEEPGFHALRRIQARSGSLLHDQAFPQSTVSLRSWLAEKPLSDFDSALLFGRHPLAGDGLLRWSDSLRGNSFHLAPRLELGAVDGAGGDTLGGAVLVGLGGRIHGRLGRQLTYATNARVYTEKTGRDQFTHQFDPEQGETYSVEKGLGDSLLDFRTFNRFEYYVKWSRDWWSLKAGRDRLHMGPGYFSSLTATRGTPPYYLLEGRIDFAPWLALDNYLLKMTDTDHDILKYAHVHRLQFKPHGSLALSYQDMVIYQDRDPDPAYLLPFVPLTFSEANNGGRDNAAMALDALWAAPGGLSLWGELFMDDLLGPASFFDDWWENRWAALAGFQWVLPEGWADADLVAEWSSVEPWTYNGREPQTSFKHFNVPSASKLGPDSRSLDVQASWRPLRWAQLRERWEWDEKGTGRPGTLGAIHVDSIDGQTKDHLADARSSWRLTHEITGYYRGYLEARAWWTQGWGAAEGHRFGAMLGAGW